MKHKRLIAILTAIILLVSSIMIYGSSLFGSYKGQVNTMISFNFEGIDKGLDPYGETFNIQQFKNEIVLQQTIEALGLDKKGIDSQLLGKSINLKGYVPEDVLDRILPNASGEAGTQMANISDMTYHPTQYMVTLQLNKALKLSKKEGVEVLNTLIENYKSYFMITYKDTEALTSVIATIDTERYDYSEYILLVEGQLNVIYEYLLAKEQACRDFVGEGGVTFGNLMSQVELLRDTDVSNAKALIDTFAITKDNEQLSSIYENRITKLQRELNQVKKEKTAVANALAEYKKDPIVVLDNGAVVDISKEEQEEREMPLYEELVEKNITLQKKSNTLAYELKYYEELYSNLMTNGTSSELSKKYLAEAENTCTYLTEQIERIVNQSVALVDEYYEKEVFAESITIVKPATYQSYFKMKLVKNTLAVGAVTGFGFLLAIIYVLVREIGQEKKQTTSL